MENVRLLFIVGAPRSGTTLLQALLATHPQIISRPETHFFSLAGSMGLLQLNHAEGNDIRLFIEKLVRKNPELKETHVKDLVRAEGLPVSMILRDIFFRLFVEHEVPVRDHHVWFVEKTPGHIYYVFEIRRIFPKARFLHIVRNPLDVIASQQETFSNLSCILPRIRAWNRAIQVARTFKNSHPQSFYEIKYEDLATHPEETLKGICRFLRIPYHSSMLNPLEAYGYIVRENETWKRKVRLGVLKLRANRWKTNLSVEDAFLGMLLCYRFAKLYGYVFPRSLLLVNPRKMIAKGGRCLWFYISRALR